MYSKQKSLEVPRKEKMTIFKRVHTHQFLFHLKLKTSCLKTWGTQRPGIYYLPSRWKLFVILKWTKFLTQSFEKFGKLISWKHQKIFVVSSEKNQKHKFLSTGSLHFNPITWMWMSKKTYEETIQISGAFLRRRN